MEVLCDHVMPNLLCLSVSLFWTTCDCDIYLRLHLFPDWKDTCEAETRRRRSKSEKTCLPYHLLSQDQCILSFSLNSLSSLVTPVHQMFRCCGLFVQASLALCVVFPYRCTVCKCCGLCFAGISFYHLIQSESTAKSANSTVRRKRDMKKGPVLIKIKEKQIILLLPNWSSCLILFAVNETWILSLLTLSDCCPRKKPISI